GELFVGTFDRDEDTWVERGTTQIVPAAEWIGGLTQSDVISGPAVAKLHDQLVDRCRLESADALVPSARTIAAIGELHVLAGQRSDVWQLEPLYLRRSAAEEKARPG